MPILIYFIVGIILGLGCTLFAWKRHVRDLKLNDLKDIQEEILRYCPELFSGFLVVLLFWPLVILFMIIYVVLIKIAYNKNKNNKDNGNNNLGD